MILIRYYFEFPHIFKVWIEMATQTDVVMNIFWGSKIYEVCGINQTWKSFRDIILTFNVIKFWKEFFKEVFINKYL